jgi:hypothetical protein
VKVIIVVPEVTPLTTPVAEPIVATAGALLVHVPQESVVVMVVELP